MVRVMMLAAAATAVSTAMGDTVGGIDSFNDRPRLFNDFSSSDLAFETDFAAGTVSIVESGYGSGGFANRHVAWFAEGGSSFDFDYGDRFVAQTTLRVAEAEGVGQVEAGFQADLFGLGLFGVLTGSGEVAAFGSTLPFFSFGQGVYNVGDEIVLEIAYTPGAGEGLEPGSTIEYAYKNLTTGSGWVSSGLLEFGNAEGGFPTDFTQLLGVGAQINSPDSELGAVDIQFSGTSIVVPTPGAAAIGLTGLLLARRRR